MYAIIETSGKQYRVEPGTVFETDRLNAAEGEDVVLDNHVLLVNNDGDVTIGRPTVEGASVTLRVDEHIRDKKVVVFKMKRRKRNRRKRGHRQDLTRVTVTDISLP